MSELSCRWTSTTTPRLLNRRHEDTCTNETCKGCLACPGPHCRNCGKEHTEQTCAGCAGDARVDLHAIGKLCGSLPDEAATKGVQSEAMALMSPAADPEAWGHLTTSLKVGRLPSGYLQCDRCDNSWPCSNPKHATGELHPLFILGTWEEVWRDALDHDTDETITITGAIRYLDMQLTYMAAYEHAPFEDFARDLDRCRRHLESVLHDQEHGDRANVDCFKCGGELERRLSKDGFEDRWTCRRTSCSETYTVEQYNLALRAKIEESVA